MSTTKWDHDLYIVQFGEITFTSFAEGSTVAPYLDEPERFKKKQGHGRTIHVKSKKMGGGIKLRLIASGPENDALVLAHDLDQVPGQKFVRPLICKDLQGNQLLFAPEARVTEVSMPEVGDDGPADREWTFHGDPFIVTPGTTF